MNATERYLGKSTKHGRKEEEEEGKIYFHGEKMSPKYGGNYGLHFFTNFCVFGAGNAILVFNCVIDLQKASG